MRAVMIDDEKNCRVSLRNNLREYCPAIEIVGEADGVTTGISLIKEIKPEVIFLDIQMIDGNGFDVLDAFDQIDFKIIFVTAFDNYAIKAFNYSAVHYLLKPVHPNDLKEAVERTHELIGDGNDQLDKLKDQYNSGEFKEITLLASQGYQNILLDNIIFIEGENNYSRFYLTDGKKIIVTKTLKSYENMLPEEEFVRTHKSFILNVNHFRRFDPTTMEVTTLNDHVINVSRRNKARFVELLKSRGSV